MSKQTTTNKKEKVVIIGAGPGGLSTGMLLSHKGYEVHIYEKMDRVGGRSSEITIGENNEYSFDMGPTFLMMKSVLDTVFKESGEESDDYLDFKQLDPMYKLYFDDMSLEITQDRTKLQQQIDKYFPGNEGSVERFLEQEGKRFEKIYPVLEKDYNSFTSFFNPVILKALPHIPFGKSMFEYLGNYFNEEKLRIAFTFQSKYLGMSPWDCPGLFVILPFLEHQFGIFHVNGGLTKISEKMAEVITKKGGHIHLETPVKQIEVTKGDATGIILEDDTHISADTVVINADFAWAATNLFEPGVLKKHSPKHMEKKQYSCSTFMVYLGLDKKYDEVPHHSIVFSSDYKSNIDDIFKRFKVTKEDFSYYIRNSSINDDSVAPENHSQIYCLVPVPNNKSGVEWTAEETEELYETLLTSMETRLGMKDIRKHITAKKLISPTEWERQYNVYQGAVFSMAHTMTQMLYFRPKNKFGEVDSCYIVGGGTHPGSGLPTIYESARIATRLIEKNNK